VCTPGIHSTTYSFPIMVCLLNKYPPAVISYSLKAMYLFSDNKKL
jgi:hypothetical protein